MKKENSALESKLLGHLGMNLFDQNYFCKDKTHDKNGGRFLRFGMCLYGFKELILTLFYSFFFFGFSFFLL